MKTIKFFALALATLALVACEKGGDDNGGNGGEPTSVKSIVLSETTLSLEIGATHTLVATTDPAGAAVTWESQNPEVATVADGVVTAVAEGNAMVVATAGGKTAACLVSVKAAGNQGGGGGEGGAKVPEGSEFYPIVMDGVTSAALGNKIIADFRPDEVLKFLYIWSTGDTYAAGTATGLNFFGNTEGYTALTVTNVGWSGAGYNIQGEFMTQCVAMVEKMIANPDDYYFHIAIKSTDNASHWFQLLGLGGPCSIVLGPTAFVDNGTTYQPAADFPRDGSWFEYEIPMSSFANQLAAFNSSAADCNIFCMLSGGVQGTQLNLDAVYFYKK